MDDSEQVDFILQHTSEPERDELAESFRSGQMTVDEIIFGENDDAAIRQAAAAATTAGGCSLLILTLILGAIVMPAAIRNVGRSCPLSLTLAQPSSASARRTVAAAYGLGATAVTGSSGSPVWQVRTASPSHSSERRPGRTSADQVAHSIGTSGDHVG